MTDYTPSNMPNGVIYHIWSMDAPPKDDDSRWNPILAENVFRYILTPWSFTEMIIAGLEGKVYWDYGNRWFKFVPEKPQ